MGWRSSDTERLVLGGEQGQDVVDPAPDVGLAHADDDLLVEHHEHRKRVDHPAVHADDRDRVARSDEDHGGVQGGEAIDTGAGHELSASASGQQPPHRVVCLLLVCSGMSPRPRRSGVATP
jgi:hypothetical protein